MDMMDGKWDTEKLRELNETRSIDLGDLRISSHPFIQRVGCPFHREFKRWEVFFECN